jgi:predicted dehydrogenase
MRHQFEAGRQSSVRKPRVGFLGAGWIGRMRLQSLVNSGTAEISAVADPSPQALSQARQIAPQALPADDLDELLEMGLDGVVIATPSALHAEQARAALRRGCAVFCEKPLACTAAETRNVVETARRMDRLLAVDFAYRFTAGMNAIRDLIRRGELGDIYTADLTFHNSYGPDKDWFYDPRLSGGGCVIDLGIHLIDAALWMLDFPPVKGVSSHLFERGRPLRPPVVNTIEDYAAATVELECGTALRLACSWRLPIGSDAFIQASFHGTKAGAELRNVSGSFYDFRADLYQGRERRQLCAPPDGWGGRALTQWARRLSSGDRFDPAAEGFVVVAEIVDAVYGRHPGIGL